MNLQPKIVQNFKVKIMDDKFQLFKGLYKMKSHYKTDHDEVRLLNRPYSFMNFW